MFSWKFNHYFSFSISFFLLQMHLSDLKHFLRAILSGKTSKISTSGWSHEATHRLIVLCLATLGLLFIRLQIMGSQLPVFTRLVEEIFCNVY
jgi:hypothetical protein